MLELVTWLLLALKVVIFVDVIVSWLMPPDRFPRNVTTQITDPLYAPIRAILRPERMGIDVSPIVILMLIYAMESMLRRAQ